MRHTETIIRQVLEKYTVSYELSGGSSLAKRIADALREAGLLASGTPLTAAALAEVDRVQREIRGNWSRSGDEAELEALRGLAEALRRTTSGRIRSKEIQPEYEDDNGS